MNNENIDLNNINREETWVDVEIIAKLKGITKRAVRMSLNNNKYIYITEKCRGGYTYRIKLSSLEEDLQIKYIKMYYNEIKTSSCELIELNNFQIKQERLISESQRDIALAKYDLIHLWLKYRKEYKANPYEETTQTINEKFVQMYNTGLLFETIFKKVGSISVGSLYRWKKLLSENQDWTALVGQYKYSTRKEYKTSLNEEQIKVFLNILLSPNNFSIGKAIGLAKHILKERGYDILPKDVTFRRYAKWFRDNNFDKWTLARQGEKKKYIQFYYDVINDYSTLIKEYQNKKEETYEKTFS